MAVSLRYCRTWLLLVTFLAFPFLEVQAAQLVWAAPAGKAQKHAAAQAPVGEAPKPQLLNADSNPTLRYPVSVKQSSISCGWLDVTRTRVSYTVVESGSSSKPARLTKFAPEGVQHFVDPSDAAATEGFDVALSEITYVGLQKSELLILSGRAKRALIYAPEDNWGTLVSKRGAFDQFAQADLAGTMAVQRAVQNFEGVLAEVKPPAPPALDVSLHADATSVEKGHSVALVWASNNATSLDLQPGVGRVAASGGISVQPQDSTNYTLTATGPAGTKTASAYVTVTAPAVAPTVVLIEPSVGNGQSVEIASSPLTIRGVVMDASGIPVVTVNGRSVTLRPTSSQAAQFTSDPLPLQPGENHIEVSAMNSVHGQAKVDFIAHLAPSAPKPQPAAPANPKGLDKAEILSLLQGDVPSARVAGLVKERGLKFAPTPDDLKEIRSAGGGDDLVDAISQASALPRS
jgi:hypothetical protein